DVRGDAGQVVVRHADEKLADAIDRIMIDLDRSILALNGRHVAQTTERRALARRGPGRDRDLFQRLQAVHSVFRILDTDEVWIAALRIDPEVRRDLGAGHQRRDDVAHHVALGQAELRGPYAINTDAQLGQVDPL